MIENFENKGIWWLSDNPSEKISGSLKFIPSEGAVLDLMGTFKEIQDRDIRNLNTFNPEIILGISLTGEKITLHKCFETKTQKSTSFEGDNISATSTISSFYSSNVFLGAHFEKKEDIKFKTLSIQYTYLEKWVNISGFTKQFGEEGEVVIKYKPPHSIQAIIDSDLKIFIDFQSNYSSSVHKEPIIKQKTCLRIEPSEEKSLDELLKIMYHIQNFISLGVTEPVFPLVIIGRTEANKRLIGTNVDYPPVKIIYALNYITKEVDTLHRFQMLFTFDDISDRFEYFIKNWLGKIELLEPIYYLYFGTIYNPNLYLQHQFLNLTQAIESYHRRVYGGEYQEKNKYRIGLCKSFVEIIPIDFDKDYKDSLKQKLKYLNEYSLRKRLKDICKENLKEVLERSNLDLLKDFKDKNAINSFADSVTDTRNYLTHYDEELKNKTVNGNELYTLLKKLKILLEIFLLKELGFSFNKINILISRKYK